MASSPLITINNCSCEASAVRVLDLHADFVCENCGNCCKTAWEINIEQDDRKRLDTTLGGAGWTPEELDRHFPPDPRRPGYFLMATLPDRSCPFMDCENGSSACLMQKAHGHKVLTKTCQTFPRLVTSSPAGVYMTLSYTCPAAARTLLAPGKLREAAPRRMVSLDLAMRGIAVLEGTKAPAMEQKCRPDWAAYDYFWRWTPELMANPDLTPAAALFGLGTAIQWIELLGAKATTLEAMIQILEKAESDIPASARAQARATAPLTQLGVIYLESLLNIMRQTDSYKGVFMELCRQPRFSAPQFRESIGSEYDRLIRPRLAEFELIERNYIASRLFANPLAWQVKRLRTAYVLANLSLVVLRFSALAICLLKGVPLDETVWLRAAESADNIMLHRPLAQERFLEILESSIEGDLKDFAALALF